MTALSLVTKKARMTMEMTRQLAIHIQEIQMTVIPTLWQMKMMTSTARMQLLAGPDSNMRYVLQPLSLAAVVLNMV
jgi:hypothetical protein